LAILFIPMGQLARPVEGCVRGTGCLAFTGHDKGILDPVEAPREHCDPLELS
jgi:hypothetical protein